MKGVLPRLLRSREPESLLPALREWFASEQGEALLESEREVLVQLLPECFGFHAFQVVDVVRRDMLKGCPILHKCLADSDPGVESLSPLICDPHELPVANDSIDLVLLHHALDASPNPHAVLREAARTLIPEGNLLVIGFNPWSLWGIFRLFRMPWRKLPWLQRPVSPYRLADWLSLLDFEVLGLESTYYLPPLRRMGYQRYFQWLDWLGRRYWGQGGAVYVIQARKRCSCITPLKERRTSRRQEMAPAFVVDSREPVGSRKSRLGTS